ncbi:hypothetical protein CALVIDRAFT_561530 [Calocera viscosa TUFC12733]|uniref:Uncharacterized protein n=1 Tax=Calocera viscosa (strain TUFC12733) TaxID=1330018 RepID=A0A167PU41_CALVF|nr:hypothetical protein CALVIDRAFT_561530 [Calocera viscosa TUFC12733]
MPFFIPRRNTPPVVEVHLDAKAPRPLSDSSSRKDKLRVSLVHLSRYFARPKSAFTAPSLSSSISTRSSDNSSKSFELPKIATTEKIVLEKRSTPEGFMLISKKPAQAPNAAASVQDKISVRSGVTRTLSTASRRGQPLPPPTMAQLAALKIYAEKALPPLPKSRRNSVVLSITPPTESIPPPAYLSNKPKAAPSAFTTPPKPRRVSLRPKTPKTPKTPNNTDSFLSFSTTPPTRSYSFRIASSAVRTSFLSLTPSPSPPTKKNKLVHRYSTTSQRMGNPNGAVLPPGKIELRVAELPMSTSYASRPLYRHPYATAIPAPSPRYSRRHD